MERTTKDILTTDDILAYLKKKNTKKSKYEKLQRYYEGKHDIEKDVKNPNTLCNNAVIHAYPKYITDMLTGYFMGKPVSYISKNENNKILDELQDIFDYSDEQEENFELSKICSIKGKAYEIVYRDEDARIRFDEVEPDDIITIYDTKINPNMKFAIREYTIEESSTNKYSIVEVYDKNTIKTYKNENGSLRLLDEVMHTFKDVPIIEYLNNKEEQGDFEQVISNIDAYNKAQTTTLADMEQFTDAYLVLVNMAGTDRERIQELKKDRVLLLDDEGSASWLIKSVNDAWVENYKERLKKDIHKFSCTPDMQDESFGSNLSGVSIRYKILAMEQIRTNKERKFKKGLQRRIELICNSLSIQKQLDDFTDIQIKFNNALPQNLLELSQIISNLSPFLSDETLISELPFIEDARVEIEKKKEEKESNIEDKYNMGGNNE